MGEHVTYVCDGCGYETYDLQAVQFWRTITWKELAWGVATPHNDYLCGQCRKSLEWLLANKRLSVAAERTGLPTADPVGWPKGSNCSG
jgi:DNA-directed RNA polymerase subunit RPC12/RpoP